MRNTYIQPIYRNRYIIIVENQAYCQYRSVSTRSFGNFEKILKLIEFIFAIFKLFDSMYMPRTCNLLKNLVIHFRTGSKRPQLRPEKLNNPSSYSGHNESYTSVRSSIKRVGVLINFSLPRIVDVLIFPK